MSDLSVASERIRGYGKKFKVINDNSQPSIIIIMMTVQRLDDNRLNLFGSRYSLSPLEIVTGSR